MFYVTVDSPAHRANGMPPVVLTFDDLAEVTRWAEEFSKIAPLAEIDVQAVPS